MAYYGSIGNFASGGHHSAPLYGRSQFGQPQQMGGFGAPSFNSSFGAAPVAQPFYGQTQFGQPQQQQLGFGAQSFSSSFAAPAAQQFGSAPFYGQTQFGQPQQQQLGFSSQSFSSSFSAPAAQQFGAAPYFPQPQYGQPQPQFGGFGQGFSNSYGFVGQQAGGATVTAADFNPMPENTQKNSLDLSQYVRSTAAAPTNNNDESPVSSALDNLKDDIEAARKAAENSPKA